MPKHPRAAILLSDAETDRVLAFIERAGRLDVAVRRLGVGPATLDAARGRGSMMAATRARLLAALDREEARDGKRT